MSTGANLSPANLPALLMALDELGYHPDLSELDRQIVGLARRRLQETRELLHSDDTDAAAVLAGLRSLYRIRKGG